jgi:hypothetical protein
MEGWFLQTRFIASWINIPMTDACRASTAINNET